MTVLFAIVLALLLIAPVLGLPAGRETQILGALPYLVGTLASVGLVVVGASGVAGSTVRLDLGSLAGLGRADLVVDQLSGLFLLITFAVATPVSLCCAAWAARRRPANHGGLAAAYALTLWSVAVVTASQNVFLFLFAWETLTLAFYLMTSLGAVGKQAARPVVTAVLGKVSGAALLVGMLLLSTQAGTYQLNGLGDLPDGAARTSAYALLVAGFATKVGLIPFHVWIPRGYQAAPGPLRAVMAGIAVNVGFYGLWRTLDILGTPPSPLVVVVLLTASVTAMLGIAHATVQTDLCQVIAYSSVENSGLIVTGYGVALVGASQNMPRLESVGLIAATLQVVAHAIAKSALFTSAAGIEDATGTTQLDELRGVGHRLPWSGLGLAVGSCTLAGLPLTAGFVSEWFLLEALMQQFRVAGLGFTLPLAIAGALVALTTGFAAVAFVRLVGLIVLGPRHVHEQRRGRDVPWLGKVGTCALAVACIAVPALAPLEIRLIGVGLGPIVADDISSHANEPGWVLQPVYADFSAVSPSKLAVVIPVMICVAASLAVILGRRRLFAVREVPAWRSASSGVQGENQYTPFGFANPTRHVLANVLLTRSAMHRLTDEPASQSTDDPYTETHAPGARFEYSSDVIEVVERFLYLPLAAPVHGLVWLARRLQSGRLDAYVAYMLIALLTAFAVVIALA